ncbi:MULTISPECIES: dihydrolipoyl dehydrogenase [unclassified Uliginosibacterium]|uniref:dihydrolipoyl dehydrogenase n=1 Tax=unclassified Uliginosibacterium TaxID=2621521 RepID=UPI000C7A5708|nr:MULTISPECIES: dihydrolipoyl dehydrogenase [unclassified Uliginosibacterium]MDO6387927.1 dihydrolipoyl dehydrogenase [Uliginosibacterium sp. 31-12]PLK50101.1 dihydrolipoyl dehydrogenase [Uliginosibacterium sp. TH139]
MSQLIEVKVPDIGDFKDIPIIELFVKPGDTVSAEDSLATLESDKATLDVPSPAAGVVKSISVKVGDRVSEGSVLLMLDAISGGAAVEAPKPAAAAPAPAAASAAPVAAGSFAGKADIECEMLVLGAGPGGYSAAFRSADLGMQTVLVERYATLGGVCLNVGCIPSKALLHVANVIDEASHFADVGVAFDAPKIDIDRLRAHKEKVISKMATGLTGMAKARKVEVVRGYGNFIDANHVEVSVTAGEGQDATGEKKIIRFQKCIIAAGSSVVKLPFIPEDPRIIDSTGALELRSVPKRMLVIGGGIIGLEMATVYSTLGARIDVVEMGDGLMPGADRDLVKVWEKRNLHRFDKIMLKTRTVGVTCRPDGVLVKFDGDQAPADEQKYDMVLVAVGRSPNGKKISAEKAGVLVTDRGFIQVDKQQRTNVPHIFAIGDIVGQPMLAHKGVHEAHVAAEVASGLKSYFDASVIPGVAYTEPEVAWVGVTETEAKATGRKIGVGKFPWAASGRAVANGCDYGFTKLIFDEETHRIIGGGIVGPNAGDMIGEITLAIEMGCDPVDIGKTIHPHPTLGESIGMAAEVFEGACTDLPPQKKK